MTSIIKAITMEEIEQIKPAMIFHGMQSPWWTHDPAHLGATASGLPCDPSGGPLFETRHTAEFLAEARANPQHYGKHGLAAFMAAHHLNCRTNMDDLKPTCLRDWNAYNAVLDAQGGEPLAIEMSVDDAARLRGIRRDRKALEQLSDAPYARCLVCGHEVSEREIEERSLSCCPKCENNGVPAAVKHDVSITINWQELRILTIWAERWISSHTEESSRDKYALLTVRAIADRIEKQCPELAKQIPLSFLGELKQIKDKFPGVTIEQNVVCGEEDLSIPTDLLKEPGEDETHN